MLKTLQKIRTKSLPLFLALIGISTLSQAQSTACGKEFWFCFPDNYYSTAEPRLQIVSDVSTSGTITTGGGSSLSFTVSPGTPFITVLSTALAVTANQTIESNKWVHIVSNDTVCTYAGSMQYGAADATPILPLQALGTDHRITSYHNLFPSAFFMVATENGTAVTITPRANTQGGNPANVPFNITLNQGQTYAVRSTVDLTGSRVQADKNIIVFNANKCANVPTGATYCDMIWDMEPDIAQWGTEYVTLEFGGRSSPNDLFRAVAHTDGTVLQINGTTVATLNAGQFYETTRNGRNRFSANFPFALTQFARGTSLHGSGDPAMVRLVPTKWMGKYYRWPAFDIVGYITNHKVNVVTKTANTGLVRVDGNPIGGWNVVTGTNWSAAYVTGLGSGDHVLFSDSALHGVAYGFGSVTSYALPLGGESPVVTILSPGLKLNLNGTQVPDQGNLLEWNLSSPAEGGHYQVMGSPNGKDWVERASLEANSGKSTFTWLDQLISKETQYHYQIIYTDVNGERTFSNILAMMVGNNEFGLKVFPNPFSDSFTLEYGLQQKGKAHFEILDATGRMLATWTDEQVAGTYQKDMGPVFRDQPAGYYLLRMTSDGITTSQTLIKQ
ncbi:MAG: T9SS type A sorting domain-containing protein [Bacteroidia bacterium]|nr:T9SS type A sorting domain-containing protein [Bacteroidia bacterium]